MAARRAECEKKMPSDRLNFFGIQTLDLATMLFGNQFARSKSVQFGLFVFV